MKGVILAGGYGTRLRPLTLVTNKHLLVVYDRPLIYYPIRTLENLGIMDICIVLGGESTGAFIKLLGDGSKLGVRLTYLYQQRAGGIAEAIGLCRSFVGNSTFMVILGDNIFTETPYSFKKGFEDSGSDCGILLSKVDNPEEYGVPVFAGEKIIDIIEKPKVPSSNYAVTGLYAYTPIVFDEIDRVKPSARDELEISDVHAGIIVSKGEIYWEIYKNLWFDCGSFDGLLSAAIAVKKGGVV